MKDERVFVALGANLGDPLRQLRGAIAALAQLRGFEVRAVSRFHRTAPVGGPAGQPDYCNAVLEGTSELEPESLLAALLALEQRFGRVRLEPMGPRTLDLDLLLFGTRRVASESLQLPHPRMEERLFVLEPLAELAPDLVLMDSGQPIRARIDELRQAHSAQLGARSAREGW